MKNIITIFLLISIQLCYSQEMGYQMTTTSSKEEFLKYSEITGSPFLNDAFKQAKATCCNEIAPMRYDIYADEIEYKKGDVVYRLLKQKPYTRIEFANPNVTLVLEDIENNNKPGYFILLADGKNSLLKKLNIKIENIVVDPKKTTGYGKKEESSSNFKESKPAYYIKTEKNTYILIKTKKDILEVYPEKSRELNNFFDSNSIKFNKDDSLIKLVNFLNK